MAGRAANDWLKSALNAALALDPEIKQKLAAMTGRVICIRLKLIERELFLFPDEDGIAVSLDYAGEADTTLTGTPLALLKMGLSKQVAPMLLSGEVEIEGDTRLGREFKKILSTMRIDWEEYASRLVGDAAAHRLFNTMRTFNRWGRKALRSIAEDSVEYVQEESRDVITGAELENYYQQVDDLRDAVDRIEQKLAQYKTGPTL